MHRQTGKQGALKGECTGHIGRHRRRPGGRAKGVGIHMISLAWRIAVMQSSLGHHNGPGWPGPEQGVERHKQVLKGHIHSVDDNQQHVCFGLKHLQVFAWVVSCFSKATGVEKDRQWKVGLWEIVAGCPARTRCKTRSDLGAFSASQSTDDRGLARLHFADEPDDWGRQALTHPTERSAKGLRIDVRSQELTKLLARKNRNAPCVMDYAWRLTSWESLHSLLQL